MKKNITIKDFVTAVDYRIGEGAEYLWECFGLEASILDWVRPDLSGSAGIIYDTKTHVVYEMEVWDDLNEKVYRWIRPENIKKYNREAKKRGVSVVFALDRIKYEHTTPTKLLNHLRRLYARGAKA
jgi:hypothetical protein